MINNTNLVTQAFQRTMQFAFKVVILCVVAFFALSALSSVITSVFGHTVTALASAMADPTFMRNVGLVIWAVLALYFALNLKHRFKMTSK